MRSTSTRFSSSGIARSNERRPASTWATGTSSLAAASAPASVEFVSPKTRTTSGCSSSTAASIARQHAARLLAVRAGAGVELVARRGEPELVEEDCRELAVVMLARVQHDLLDAALAQSERERADFTNCGRLPTTERIRTPPANVAERHDREASHRWHRSSHPPFRRKRDPRLVRAAPSRATGLTGNRT